jgi:hypothetical protein
LHHLVDEFLPDNPECRLVTAAEIPSLFKTQNTSELSRSEVREVVRTMASGWQDRPPDYIAAAGENFSLVNAYEALAKMLTCFGADGQLPIAVSLSEWYGPIGEVSDVGHADSGRLALDSILGAARAALRRAETLEPPRPPLMIQVAGQDLNAAEFLLVMARAFLALDAGTEPGSIEVTPEKITPPYAAIMERIFHPGYDNPLWYSKLQLWTVKPARLNEEATS